MTHILALRPLVIPHVAQIYYIHVDHLNTPRLVADATGTTVWRWDQAEPFGVNVPDENPSGLGAFEFPFRFPGQYADKETNLAYNYFRDYDPSLGIYKESDPIGLRGGFNTYAYVTVKPLSLVDPLGLETGGTCLQPPRRPGSGGMPCFLLEKVGRICTYTCIDGSPYVLILEGSKWDPCPTIFYK